MLKLILVLAVVSQAGKISIDWKRNEKQPSIVRTINRSLFNGMLERKTCDELYDIQLYPESSYDFEFLRMLRLRFDDRARIARAARFVKMCFPREIVPYLIISLVLLIAAIFFGFFSTVISNILYSLSSMAFIASVGYYVIIGYLDYHDMVH